MGLWDRIKSGVQNFGDKVKTAIGDTADVLSPWQTKREAQRGIEGTWGSGSYTPGDVATTIGRTAGALNPFGPGPIIGGMMGGAGGTMIGAGADALTGNLGQGRVNPLSRSGGSMDPANAYLQLGSPNDVSQVNPYTDPFMQQLQQQGGGFYNQLGQGMGGMTSMINALDPMAAQNEFINNGAGAMRNIAAQNMDPFANQQRADYLSNQALSNVSGFFGDAGPGALRSGAGMSAMMEGALNPFTQMNQNLANMQTQQAGQLQGQNMSNLANQFGNYSQMGLGAQGQQNSMLAGLYGNTLGQQGQVARPEWWQPTYMPNPSHMSPQDLVSTAADVAGGIMPFF